MPASASCPSVRAYAGLALLEGEPALVQAAWALRYFDCSIDIASNVAHSSAASRYSACQIASARHPAA